MTNLGGTAPFASPAVLSRGRTVAYWTFTLIVAWDRYRHVLQSGMGGSSCVCVM
jgi:hypothetical protein